MTTEAMSGMHEVHHARVRYKGGSSEAVYGLGMIGAWIYYLSHAATFWIGVLGFVKGIFWPAFIVYELMKYLKM